MPGPSVVWFRDDLRLADNPALRAALDRGEPVIALYVLDEETPGIRPLGGAARWWLHHSLASLGERLRERGGTLVLRRGPADRVVREAVTDAAAGAVFWNRRYGGPEREVDAGAQVCAPRRRRRGVVVRRLAAVRALDRAHRRRYAVLGLHALLARLPRPSRTARTAARPA